MSWRSVKVEEQRLEFVKACLEGELTVAELCRMYDISRKNGYKWIKRYNDEGPDGLNDRSRAPHSQALKVNDQIEKAILNVRFKFPTWGPKKIFAYLQTHYPDIHWPSTTTIGNLFDKNGLTIPRKLRKRVAARTAPLSHCLLPNDVWCGDFKGWFTIGESTKCEPFTLTDGASRFLMRCLQLNSNDTEHVWAILDAAFREYGLPLYFRTDNGPPFATCGAGRLSKLSINLIKAGVIPEWIDPGKPQQNGRHERMHQTLKNETATPPQFTLEEQSMKFKEFIHYYNYVRPHEAIDQKTPSSVYQKSPRVWNGRLRPPEYSKGFIVRKVRPGGQISMRSFAPDIQIGLAFIGEYVGLKQISEQVYEVYYGPVILGKIDESKKLITPLNVRKRNLKK